MKGNSLFGAIRAFFVYSEDDAGSQLTGVARYLQEHNIEPQPKAKTSVDRYLEELAENQAIAAEAQELVVELEPELTIEESPEPEVLEPVDQQPAYTPAPKPVAAKSNGGLFGAIRSFFIYDEPTGPELTGVERYLQDNIAADPEPEVAVEEIVEHESEAIAEQVAEVSVAQVEMTGVDRYLAQADSTVAYESEVVEAEVMAVEEAVAESIEEAEEAMEIAGTSVDRYMQEQEQIESDLPLVTGVEMYLQDIEAQNKERVSSTGVGEYLDQACKQEEAEAIIAKYQQQDKVEQSQPLAPTSVANYIETYVVGPEQDGGQTSVMDYLARSEKIAEAEVIVANYLQRQHALQDAQAPAPSSVALYIERQEQKTADDALSGVDAYMEKADIEAEVADIIARYQERERIEQEKQAALQPQENRVSVVKIRHRKPSTVARYIEANYSEYTSDPAAMSSVEKFLFSQENEAKQKQAAEIIERYLAYQAELNAEPISSVAQYIANMTEVEASTGVLSSVDRYLIERPAAILSDPEPVVVATGVARYLEDNVAGEVAPKRSTSVDQYLANQVVEASKMPPAKLSGVDRYMLNQA